MWDNKKRLTKSKLVQQEINSNKEQQGVDYKKEKVINYLLTKMFQNSFQNGNYFELFDPKISQDKQKNLYKLVNISNLNNKVFDKELKTYVLQFTTPNGKIVFPKQDKKDLYLIQQYLVFQVYFFHGMQWSMELVISDLNKTKRRIMISSTNNKLEVKPFFVKCPNPNWKEGCWNNFAIDLYSFMEAFKGQTYRCLDTITIMGHFKLRRIYTTNTAPRNQLDENEQNSIKEISLLPKNFYFPPEIEQASLLTRYMGQTLSQVNLYEPTEPSTKNNSSYLKSSKNRMSTPKTQTTKSQKIVQVNGINKVERTDQQRFLANTNGPQMLNRMRKRQKYNQSSDSQSQITQNVKTPQSTQKGDIRSKKKLIKTQVMPPKARTSVQKRSKLTTLQEKKQKEKQKLKSKLNPWRTNTKANETKKLSNMPQQSDADQSSPNTTQFKVKNEFTSSISKGFDRKSDHYSESQYIELSQKFSTLTDGKFFNRATSNLQAMIGQKSDMNDLRQLENTQEIEQNIEMETNSIYSLSNKKQQLNVSKQFIRSPQKLQMINQSICDSLDRRSPAKDFQQIGKQSYYGFGDRLMNEYMRERERPYSPPMREKEYTEEQEEENNVGKDKEVELVYDPVLNCYYDHKTHTYYQLKN